MKQQKWAENQLKQAMYDGNERVGKGSDLGVANYTRLWLYVGGTIVLFVYVASTVSTHLDMEDPLTGMLFTFGMVAAFWQLLKKFNGGKR